MLHLVDQVNHNFKIKCKTNIFPLFHTYQSSMHTFEEAYLPQYADDSLNIWELSNSDKLHNKDIQKLIVHIQYTLHFWLKMAGLHLI